MVTVARSLLSARNVNDRRPLLLFWLVALALPAAASAQEPVDALVDRPRSNRAALFDDELDLLERAVLGWLEQQDLAVRILPANTRDTLEAPECAAPMSHHDVVRERLGRVARVSITAGCYGDPPCRLSVRITRPPVGAGAWERLHEWRAEVPDGAGQVARFLAAVPHLVEPPPPDGVGVGLLMGGRDEASAPVRIDWVAPAGRWRNAPSPATIAEAIQSELDACHEEGWSSGPQERAILAFARDGSVSRCEAILRHEPIDRARATCLCGALSNARVPAGGSDRRIELGLMNSTSSGVLAGEVRHHTRFEMRGAEGGFRAYPGFQQVREPAARCFAMTGINELTRVGLRVFADEHGTMTRAEIDGTGLSPELARCLQGVLRPLAFTCPASGEAAIWSGDLVGYTEPR
jgi:hypothetical protein